VALPKGVMMANNKKKATSKLIAGLQTEIKRLKVVESAAIIIVKDFKDEISELKKRNKELEEMLNDGSYIASRHAQRIKHDFYADEATRKKHIEEDRLAKQGISK